MISKAEEFTSRWLRAVLTDLPDGASIDDSKPFREALSGLEYFLPQVLSEIHPEWKHESLDGILPFRAHKSGEGEAEIFGLCILISDQALTPIYICLQVADATDEVSWLECRLGERGKDGMVRIPYSLSSSAKRLYGLDLQQDRIDWVYHVTFGSRHLSIQPSPGVNNGRGKTPMPADVHEIETEIRYMTTEEGGRRTGVMSGYRGQFFYHGEDHVGFQYYPDLPEGGIVILGKPVRAMIQFPQVRWEAVHANQITVGMPFQIREGSKTVGHGIVRKV